MHVGYSPIITVDADKIVNEMPRAHVLHIVRNPWSAYADTKKRAVPLSLQHYTMAWSINQQSALTYSEQHPGRVHVLRFEDIVTDPVKVLGDFLAKIGVSRDNSLAKPTWNGKTLQHVYPWGTIRTPTTEANRATAEELTSAEKQEIYHRTKPYLDLLGYGSFWEQVRRAA